MVRSLVFSAGFLFFFAVPLFLFAQSRPAVGSEAPNFTLKSQDGTPVSLKDFRGKWVVLFFYPQDFGGACTVQVQNFQRDLKEYQQKGAVLLGISINDVESHQRFSTKEGLQYKILSDNDQAVSRLYGTLRNMVLVKYAM